MNKHVIKIRKISKMRGMERWRRAEGSINGIPYYACTYVDHHSLRGAEPVRWRVRSTTQRRELTSGERTVVAKALKAYMTKRKMA